MYMSRYTSPNLHNNNKRNPWLYGFLIFPTFCFGLGVWQVKRLYWKLDLIERREKLLSLPSLPLDTSLTPEEIYSEPFMSRSIKVEGKFLHDKEMYVAPRTLEGKNGAHIVTPFETSDGKTILVNRGWVPHDKVNPERRKSGQIEDKVTIEGVLRKKTGKASYFIHDNNPSKNEWFWINIDEMASHSKSEPIFLDLMPNQNKSFEYPLSGITMMPLNNPHLNYALTWFSLSAILTGMSIVIIRRGRVFPKPYYPDKF